MSKPPQRKPDSAVTPKPDVWLPGPSSDTAMFHTALARALAATGRWFEFGGVLVEALDQPHKFHIIYHTPHSIVPALEHHVRFLRWSKDSPTGLPASPKVETARGVLESQAFAFAMPHVRIFADNEMPYLAPDGSLQFTLPGYNPDCQVYQPLSAIVPIETSSQEAGAWIEEFCADFPFASLGDITSYLAYLLTAYCRLLFPGQSPIFAFTANTSRAGKDCLVIIVHCTFGDYVELSLSTKESETDEKRFTATVMSGKRLIHFANIAGRLRNPFLERISTAPTYSERPLHAPRIFSCINDFILSLSGNSDFTVGGDLQSRIVYVRLFLDAANPNARTFKRPNPPAWAVTNRFATLGMLKRFLLDFHAAGQPKPQGAFASFPGWWNGPAAIAANALGTPPDVGSTSLQSDPRVDGLAHVLDVLNDPIHPDREWIPAGLAINPRAWCVGELREFTAALQLHDPDLLTEFPLNAAEWFAAQSAACRFGRFIHARAAVPTGSWLYTCINPEVSRAERRTYKIVPVIPPK